MRVSLLVEQWEKMITNVLAYLEASAARYPQKLAFSDGNIQVSYRDLLSKAKAVGSCLIERLHGKTGQPVAVTIDRDVASLIAFMGVVYSGNFYVPLDPGLPGYRIETILNTLQPEALLLNGKTADIFSSSANTGQKVFIDDATNTAPDTEGLDSVRDRMIDTNPLYAIFTSGSTGVPKCAVICHRSVIDLVEHFSEAFSFSSECIFGNQAPFDFDVSVKDLYCTLRNSGTMHILPRTLFSFPGKLIEALNENKINTTIWATSALRIVSNLKGLEKDLPKYLKQVMFSGEVMPNKVLNYWRKHLPDVQFVNLYGPTEITCNCTYFIVNRPFSDNDRLPIGKPFINTDILVLNEQNLPVGAGETGEICVRGTSLALGYYNNTAETSRAFCQNPLNPHYPELIYRTGDLGCYNELGELIFLSRKDNQIKHMGHRIELGEIEIAANALSFLDAACCMYDAEREKIVLFYQASQSCDREILLGLQEFLPKYMLPNKLVHVEQLPLNKNAKIDRTKLKEDYFNGPG